MEGKVAVPSLRKATSPKQFLLLKVAEDEGWVADIREGEVEVSPKQVFGVVEGIGGARSYSFLRVGVNFRNRAGIEQLPG